MLQNLFSKSAFEANRTTNRTYEVLELLLLSTLAILYVAWGVNYHIHTSEFWSIHVAGEFFNSDFRETIWIKPFFHLVLKIPYFFSMTDATHLRIVKFIFSVNGALQILLSFLIFKHFCKEFRVSFYYAFFGVFLLAVNPFYLNFAFRIRSDLLATTLFLLFVFLRVCKNNLPIKYDLVFLVLFPLIGLKHIFFSFVAGVITLTSGRKFQLALSRHYVFALAVVTALVWILSLGWNSVTYYLSTLNSYKENLGYIFLWIKNDAVLITLGLIPLVSSFLSDLESAVLSRLRFLHITALIYFLLVSQKFSFFIASLIPIFFISTFLGLVLLIEKIKSDRIPQILFSIIGFAYLFLAVYNFKNYFPYHSNSDQFKFISAVAPVLHDHKLSVLDGTGIFPRVPNWKCFYSPDDEKSIRYCRDLITNSKPLIIILTGRLLNIISGDAELESYGYKNVGAGIFILQSSILSEALKFNTLPPAAITFGFDI